MVDKLLLPFPLLIDGEGDVIKRYGVWNENDGGVASPSILAIRKDGTVAWSYVGRDYADRPTDDDLFASIRGGN